MKKLLFLFVFASLSAWAFAQQPETTTAKSQTTQSKTDQSESPVTILEPASKTLVYNVENTVKVSIKGVNANYLIIKPLDDSTCTLRHDRDAGVYIITPVIPEGVITLRVGYMDFLGAYKRVDEIDFTVVAEQPKQE